MTLRFALAVLGMTVIGTLSVNFFLRDLMAQEVFGIDTGFDEI